jgi:hypothetical protein
MVIISILLLTFLAPNYPSELILNRSELINRVITDQDTLKNNQAFYTGKVWKNTFRRIKGDQFLFTNYFLDGVITTNGKTYRNIKIKYDIYSDEILIPVDIDEVVQLNKEMIDSFAIEYENILYHFAKINTDSLEKKNDLEGYFCLLYKGKSALYIKYSKYILPNISDKSDGDFIQTYKAFIVKDKTIYPVLSKKDLYTRLNIDKTALRNYLRNNKLKIIKDSPSSYIPVIRFYDSLSQ